MTALRALALVAGAYLLAYLVALIPSMLVQDGPITAESAVEVATRAVPMAGIMFGIVALAVGALALISWAVDG